MLSTELLTGIRMISSGQSMQTEKSGFIRQIGFDDVRAFLPEVMPWDGMAAPPDVYITALGFEDRAVAITEELASRLAFASVPVVLVGCYESNLQDNECNGDRMRQALEKFCRERRDFGADNPSGIDQTVRAAIEELMPGRNFVRVVFDISGSSGTLILSVMAALTSQASRVKLEVVYAEPQEYSPSKHEYECNAENLVKEGLADGNENSFVEQGVSDVDINELYPGHNVENRPDRVLAIPSLRTSRLVRCLAHIGDQTIAAPQDSILWLLGEPPSASLKWRQELQRMIILRQLAQMVGKEPGEDTAPTLNADNLRVASTRDYRNILQILIAEIDESTGSNIWLVHMGSKLQAIGVALALHVRDEVAVLRSRPKQFNAAKYSKGVGTLWRLVFDDLAELLAQLQKVGQIELQAKLETSREERPAL
jgi:hypothetical protein